MVNNQLVKNLFYSLKLMILPVIFQAVTCYLSGSHIEKEDVLSLGEFFVFVCIYVFFTEKRKASRA